MLILTLVLLVAAIALAVFAWRLLQEERRRSDARVAVLAAELATATAPATPDGRVVVPEPAAVFARRAAARASEIETRRETIPEVQTSADEDDLHLFDREGVHARPAPVRVDRDAEHVRPARIVERDLFRRADDTDLAIEPEDVLTPTVSSTIFGSVDTPARRGRWLPALAIGGLLLVGSAVAYLVLTGPDLGVTGQAVGVERPPIELATLRHDRQPDALIIHGLVRNPPGGATLRDLTAVVFFFDVEGQFLTSVRAPLEFRELAPGDESPFEARLPQPRAVKRYRVSFRDASGRLLSHVDRRDPTAAGSQGGTRAPGQSAVDRAVRRW